MRPSIMRPGIMRVSIKLLIIKNQLPTLSNYNKNTTLFIQVLQLNSYINKPYSSQVTR